jgi:hypothetical protein
MSERESVSVQLECGTGLELPGSAFELEGLPRGAAYDAATRTLTFTPELDQAGTYDIVITVAGTTQRGKLELGVADAFDAPANVPVDPSTYREEYGLPVLHLGTDPTLNSEGYTPASITYRGKSHAGAEAKYRGRTSLGYPKNSYTLKFAKTDRFGDERVHAGFVGKRKVTLTTTFDDRSHLRARLAFDMWNRIDPEHVQVQAYHAVVYLDGQFHGLYTVTDHVDGNLMEDNGLFEDGNLYKARSHDANFRLTRQASPSVDKLDPHEGYEKKEGVPLHDEPGAFDDLDALVTWVATASQDAFSSELDTRIVRSDYESWWFLVSLIVAADSAGKNSYHYRDGRPGAADGRFRVVPWDFNDSFGQSWRANRRSAFDSPDKFIDRNGLFERLLASPETREPLVERYQAALLGPWAVESILERVNTWADQIHQVALRDERKWAGAYLDYFGSRDYPTEHEQALEYMRRWISDRWAHVTDFYAHPPAAAGIADAGAPEEIEPAGSGSADEDIEGSGSADDDIEGSGSADDDIEGSGSEASELSD